MRVTRPQLGTSLEAFFRRLTVDGSRSAISNDRVCATISNGRLCIIENLHAFKTLPQLLGVLEMMPRVASSPAECHCPGAVHE
jgi:hypothetical protein